MLYEDVIVSFRQVVPIKYDNIGNVWKTGAVSTITTSEHGFSVFTHLHKMKEPSLMAVGFPGNLLCEDTDGKWWLLSDNEYKNILSNGNKK